MPFPLRPLSLIVLAVLVVALPALPTAAANEPGFVVTIDQSGHASVTAGGAAATLRTEEPGERYVFDLMLSEAYTTGEVRILGGVDVERPIQLVPEVDDSAQHPDAEHLHPHFFALVHRDVALVDQPAHILNITGTAATFTFHLGLIGPGASVLMLTRDVEAPVYRLGEPTEVAHNGFQMTSSTDEFAYGNLRVWIDSPDDAVEFPTAVPALDQNYPVQGLRADSDYLFHIDFTDWAGNNVTSEPLHIRTLPAPDVDAPTLLSVEPEANATVPGGGRIAATFRSPTPIAGDGVVFFLDKVPIPGPFAVEAPIGASDVYVVGYHGDAPLAGGEHVARFEVTNAAGGTTGATWRFVVGDGVDAPAAGFAAVIAVALAAFLCARRRG